MIKIAELEICGILLSILLPNCLFAQIPESKKVGLHKQKISLVCSYQKPLFRPAVIITVPGGRRLSFVDKNDKRLDLDMKGCRLIFHDSVILFTRFINGKINQMKTIFDQRFEIKTPAERGVIVIITGGPMIVLAPRSTASFTPGDSCPPGHQRRIWIEGRAIFRCPGNFVVTTPHAVIKSPLEKNSQDHLFNIFDNKGHSNTSIHNLVGKAIIHSNGKVSEMEPKSKVSL